MESPPSRTSHRTCDRYAFRVFGHLGLANCCSQYSKIAEEVRRVVAHILFIDQRRFGQCRSSQRNSTATQMVPLPTASITDQRIRSVRKTSYGTRERYCGLCIGVI